MSHSVSVIDNKPSGKVYVFEGDFSIQNIEITKDEIQNNIISTGLVVLDINGVTSIDVSFMQLLFSVIEHCRKNNIGVQVLSTGLCEECRSVISKSGFDKIIRK